MHAEDLQEISHCYWMGTDHHARRRSARNFTVIGWGQTTMHAEDLQGIKVKVHSVSSP